MKATYLLGRMIFGGYFLYAGIHHMQESEAMAQYTASKGIPAPELAVKATGLALIAGGTSVLLGLKKEWGAAAIASFLVGVSPIMHDFWKQEDPERRQNEMINFGKNMALLGASLALMAWRSHESGWPPVGARTTPRNAGPATNALPKCVQLLRLVRRPAVLLVAWGYSSLPAVGPQEPYNSPSTRKPLFPARRTRVSLSH